MALKEGDATEVREWRESVTWIDPSAAMVNGEELRWEKLSIQDARASFRVLEKMRPLLNTAELQTEADTRSCRDRLGSMKDPSGVALFSSSDLGFYDLYFGDHQIKVSKVGDVFDVNGGRHRLWLAQQDGVKELPARVSEPVNAASSFSRTKEAGTMSDRELGDIQNEAEEQQEQFDEMKGEVEQHKERAEKLEETLREIRAAGQELGSDDIRKAEASAEKAKAETERQLNELRDQREKLLDENKNLTEKLNRVNDGRRRADTKVAMLEASFGNASPEFRAQIENVGRALSQELKNLSETQTELEDVRQNLEGLEI
jgi:hypothetical protein